MRLMGARFELRQSHKHYSLLRSQCSADVPAGGESEYRATYTNHDTNVQTEVDFYGPWEEHDGKIIDHSQQDRVLANVCRENIFDRDTPRIPAAGPGTEYFLQVVAGVDLASVATIAVGFDMIVERMK